MRLGSARLGQAQLARDAATAASRVTVTRTLSYTIIMRSASTRALSYSIVNRRSSTRSLSYSMVNRLGATRSLSYTIQGRPTSTRTVSYSIVNRRTSNRALLWNIGNAPVLVGGHHGLRLQPQLRREAELREPVDTAAGPSALFDGTSSFVTLPDHADFSQPTTGQITVVAWMRPDVLTFPTAEAYVEPDGAYVHWMGKGGPTTTTGEHEWLFRIYNKYLNDGVTPAARSNRCSFYAFNPQGGLGVGSFFQDTLTAGKWMMLAGRIDATTTSIYRNGVKRDQDLLNDGTLNIVPVDGSKPVKIGTRDGASFFKGGISRVAFFNTLLSDQQVADLYAAAAGSSYDEAVLAVPSLTHYYPLNEGSGSVALDYKGTNHGTYTNVAWETNPPVL